MSKNENVIFKCIAGSHMYGTNIETSDKDYKSVYIQSPEMVLEEGYREQITHSDDDVSYEIRRFVDLAAGGNPNMIELLFCPQDCIIYEHPVWNMLKERRYEFLSKSCRHSFIGYAYEQIKKAKGLDKKMNWEKERTIRKTPLDFCYIVPNNEKKSIAIKDWLKAEGFEQEYCGLSHIDHFRFTYFLFYDFLGQMNSTNPRFQGKGFDFKGIIQNEETSNSLSISNIPDYAIPSGIMSYNSDGYEAHCKDYLSYITWIEKRNEARYTDSSIHGQGIDGKNLLHCTRLLNTGKDIALKNDLIVRRPEAPYLISIRKGEVDLQTLLDNAENTITEVREAFDNSTLPEKADRGALLKLVTKIRKEYYNENK